MVPEAPQRDPDATQVTLSCPGCHAQLVVDIETGTVVWHQPPPEPAQPSLGDLVKNLEAKRQEVAERFERERRALSTRGRVLEEKVKESLKRVDPNSPPPLRPIDLD